MSPINFYVPYLFNPGILAAKMPESLLSKVKEIVTNPDAKKITIDQYGRTARQTLVGSIKQEFFTPNIQELNKFINEMYTEWKSVYKTSGLPYKIETMWTNYMKKGEFNPNHIHPNTLAVFVIWVTIPYNIEDELEYDGYESETEPSRNSAFEFTYTTYSGEIRTSTIYVNKEMEGTVCMFPGTLRHCVYPFYTSDEERISISGNIVAM